MKIQWHSYFAQVMEKVCTRRKFIVEREQEVGKMPLRIDLIVVRKKDIIYKDLESPYSYFKDINILEFKSKTDRFSWNDLYQIEIYGRLYGILKKIVKRKNIAVWSVSSHYTELYRNNLKEAGVFLEKIDSGFAGGKIAGFDYYEMDLAELPLRPEYYPFHLFGKKDEHIRRIIRESIIKPESFRDYDKEMLYLYSNIYQEVFYNMIELNPLEAGCDIEGLRSLMLGESPLGQFLFPKVEDELIKKLDEDKIIKKLGEDKIINKLGEDKIIKKLGKKLGKKKILEMLDELEEE